jgi:hypothetical protein
MMSGSPLATCCAAPVGSTLRESVRKQREMLTALLGQPMQAIAAHAAAIIDDREELEQLLQAALPTIPWCKHLYLLDFTGRQLTSNITAEGSDSDHLGRERMDRPYMQGIIGTTDFKLSEAYISRNKKRPSLTAIQVVRNGEGELRGFLGADFDLRELPHTQPLYQEPTSWRQIKGDPAIRSGIFINCRVDSAMDQQMDEVLSLLNELILERGIYHGKFHFSSSRVTVWHVDDPFVYRILSFNELIDPDSCLAFPTRPYHPRAVVPPEQVMEVFEMMRSLRFADENLYLRAGSLNIINGMVGLNFSCDGSHYMPFDEFLSRSIGFWFGTAVTHPNQPNG